MYALPDCSLFFEDLHGLPFDQKLQEEQRLAIIDYYDFYYLSDQQTWMSGALECFCKDNYKKGGQGKNIFTDQYNIASVVPDSEVKEA